MEWDDLSDLERKTHSRRYGNRHLDPDSEGKRLERDEMRAQLGDMEDD